MISAMPRIAIAVHDFAKAVHTFREVLGMPVLDFSPRTVPSLGAHVGMCVPAGGSNIELMAPATPDAPLAQALQGFLDRRDEGLYALMLEAPDPNAEAEEVAGRGLDVLPLMSGAGGRDIHPRSTHGVLVRIYPENSAGDTGEHDTGEPGLSGISRVIVATSDARQAARAYGEGFGLATDEPITDSQHGVLSVTCRPRTGGVIELVSVLDEQRPLASAISAQLAARGEGMFALVLESNDPSQAAGVLESRGLITENSVTGVGVEMRAFGTRIVIE